MPQRREGPAALLRLSLLCSLAGVCACLTACVTFARDDLVWIGVGGDNSCLIDVESRRFILPQAEAELAAHLARLAGRTAGALVGPRPARARPGCWDDAVALALRAGFRRIGYVSDAAPPPGEIG